MEGEREGEESDNGTERMKQKEINGGRYALEEFTVQKSSRPWPRQDPPCRAQENGGIL